MKKDDDPLSVDEETANKMTFIIESGLRMHTTDFDWPKSHAPSHFATRLRKHLRNKRIEDIRQVGVDRLVDIQFGSNLAANHLIVELYDRGNLILTDNNYSILNILRWRRPTTDKSDKPDQDTSPDDSENFSVGQRYPIEKCRQLDDIESMSEENIMELLNNANILLSKNQNYKKRNKTKENKKDGMLEINLKNLLNPYVVYGSSLLEDKLLNHITDSDQSAKKCVIQVPTNEFGRLDQENVRYYAGLIRKALCDADVVLKEVREKGKSPGYIIQKKQNSELSNKISSIKKGKDTENEAPKSLTTNIDFFPILSCARRKIQQESEELVYQEFDSFDKAVDVYYCNMESQKLDSKSFVAEKEAQKKLENLKIAQEKRLGDLARAQKEDEERARLIELNSDKVENALLIIRSMIANQVSWSDIWKTIKDAQAMKDPIASLITGVKFDRNEFTMKLSNPYEVDNDEEIASNPTNTKQRGKEMYKPKFKNIEIDISLSAYANARRFFVKRRTAVNKEKKTIEVSKKAFKNVERRTKEMLKEVVVTANITKARKRYWFENFFWFISSDGYLVVAGRDAEQNDLLVKRYMKNNDIYVHADLHGAASVIIKNESSQPVPPKTLTEAGSMAVCYSSAWDSKIATTSWWVYPKQVSKTAPAGEYLSVGAFIIRGKKNFLPLSNLVLGFGFLFRIEEESIERRKAARLAREASARSNEQSSAVESAASEDGDDPESESEDQSIPDEGSGQDDSDSISKPEDSTNHKSGDATNDDQNHEDLVESEDDEDIEEENRVTEHRLIDTLSESPLPDDVLLYAIPMCGPYSALQAFKYKVKVIPGANKRGKAAKACLGVFLHDKRASQRERDLLRALRDQDYARNIPNKVKISAANMKTITKKKPKKQEVRLPLQ